MHQIKIFSREEHERDQLENEINDWLRSTGAKVVSVTGNISPQTVVDPERTRPIPGESVGMRRPFASSDVLIVIVYEPGEKWIA